MRTNDDPILVENLRRHVDYLAGVIGPRHLGNPTVFHAAAAYVERELVVAGYGVKRHTYETKGHTVANLISELPGSGQSTEIVVVGAHYDSVASTPGADDNASAVAVMLEAARLMRRLKPTRTVRFVGFACEEPPFFLTGEMGSQVYARRCRERGERIRGMLCLEMVGYYSTAENSQKSPASLPAALRKVLPKRGDFLAAVGNLKSWRLLWHFRRGFKRAVRFPLLTLSLPERVAEIRLSDNSSFWDQGYPALMITDTSFLRNPHYHMASDTPDTLDYERMALVTRGVVGGAMAVAGRGRTSKDNAADSP